MPFQLKQTIMRGCTVTVLLVTLTHVAVDAGFFKLMTGSALRNVAKAPKMPKIPKLVRNLGAVVKKQKIDPHIDQKIDVMLDLAPSPYEEELDTGYNDCCFCACTCKESAGKEGRLTFWMPFQLKRTIMRGCTVAVVLVTLTRVAVDAGVITNIGAAAKEQKIDPHIEHKIDIMLDLAPSPEEAVQDTGYNGTGISGNPLSKEFAVIQIRCSNCLCKLFVKIDQYGAQMGCTQAVKKLLCSCPPASCYMNEVTKCLEKWATQKCKYESLLFTCP
nr:uncharacterized protein LOC126537810 isoform X2 [Dermacentor andersoni]